MSGSNGSPSRPRFQVSFAGNSAEQGREARRAAASAGVGLAFSTRMSELISALQRTPLTLGEPLYELRHAKLQVRKVVKPPVILYYGVHETARQVFIRGVEFLPPPT